MLKRLLTLFAVAAASRLAFAQAVLPGYLTDPSVMKNVLAKDDSYQPPDRFKYPYISTYYVKPTVKAGEAVKVGVFVTDFDSSKIRFLDDSHSFTAYLEYRLAGGGKSTVLTLGGLKSGDAEFDLGRLPVGSYEMRVWAVDAKGRESHRVIHDFRVLDAADLRVSSDKVYTMSEADLSAYGIRNDGDFERVVHVGAGGKERVVREKRASVPGYTVTVPLDPKTGNVPVKAFKQAKIAYDNGYDKAAVEAAAAATTAGLQKLINEKAAAGFRMFVMLPGTYRISWTNSLFVPSNMTLYLGKAVLKQNGFAGASSVMVRMSSVTDAHLVGGTLEGDYWSHDYEHSPNNSEWPAGFEIGGDSRYCSVERVKVADITGYGGQNGIRNDSAGGLSFFYETLPKFAPGGLDAKTGEVDAADALRFTTDFKDIRNVVGKGVRRLQVSKYLGYQGRATRSWQMTVAWYDSRRRFISSETSWQFREMWIPSDAAFLRVSVEDESADAADKAGLRLTAFRIPVNCAVRNCRFEHCRCVGYAASAMKNMLFEGNFFTQSGECAARCAFDAEDGWDQMQDVYFYRNVFSGNPVNNSILTCAGHNFVLEENDGDIYFWGRTHSPCVRNNSVGSGTYRCDSRLRSGYGRFEGNSYAKGVTLGLNESKTRPDNWDYVLSGLLFEGGKGSFNIDVGAAGRAVNCTFRNMSARIANAYACTFENCSDGGSIKPFPGGRWFEVTVKDSTFSRLYMSNVWERCHFSNVKFDKLIGGSFLAKNCDFAKCTFFGLDASSVKLLNCRLDDTTVAGNYWEKPADLVFRGCTINMHGDAPFLRLAVYTIGRLGFDECAVSGVKSLVDVFDVRPMRTLPGIGSAANPDDSPGTIALRRIKWSGPARTVVTHGKDRNSSSKKVTILNKENSWPTGVSVASDLLPSWEIK